MPIPFKGPEPRKIAGLSPEEITKDEALVALLEKQPYLQYQFHELLAFDVDPLKDVSEIVDLHERLNRLIKKGIVRSHQIDGTEYFFSQKARPA